jgi:hypothetical protein
MISAGIGGFEDAIGAESRVFEDSMVGSDEDGTQGQGGELGFSMEQAQEKVLYE